MKLTVDVNTDNEWCDDGVDAATVELTKEQLLNVATLSELVKKNYLYRVSVFENPLDYFVDSWDNETGQDCLTPWEGRVEAVTLNVTTNNFYWSGYYKHTNIRWETTSVSISDIIECSDLEFDARSK